MENSHRPSRRYVREGWIAFCCGWWLAGVILGFGHFTDLLARPSPGVLEALVVSAAMGGLLPGGAPFWFAADIVGVRGLPVGFTGFLIGGATTLVVWVTLPLALAAEHKRQSPQKLTRRHLIAAAIPYLAAAPALEYLYRTYRAGGREPAHAGGFAVATSALAYFIGAGIIVGLGLVIL